MKSLFLLLAFIVIVFAQNKKCPFDFSVSSYLRGKTVGLAYSPNKDEHFTSEIGTLEQALYYVEENITAGMLMQNQTLIASDGVTGMLIVMGWGWLLANSEGVYILSKFNGKIHDCEKYDPIEIPNFPQMLGNLYQIDPPGDAPKADNTTCQGLWGNPEIQTIMTAFFLNKGDNPMTLALLNRVSEGIESSINVEEMRPLESADADKFKNPCVHAERTNNKARMRSRLIF